MKTAGSDTIAALATPVGRAAISVVRVSGPRAREIIQLYFRFGEQWIPRRVCLGGFESPSGTLLDQVLVTWFRAPASYTGEDLCEISCHGSPALVEAILAQILSSGARLARPGEFTMRAFLNRKIDLLQAEAVRDLIESNTRFEAQIAAEQVGGQVSRKLSPIREELIRICSHLETSLEFVEDEAEADARKELCGALQVVEQELEMLGRSFQLGRLVREGYKVSICGRTNVGKSSLFNSLMEQDRVIVTPHPGTTRDAVGEICEIAGLSVRLVDTAGIRETADPVEQLGVKQSWREIESSDLVLLVLDGSEPFGPEDADVWKEIGERSVLLVCNKTDLKRVLQVPTELIDKVGEPILASALHGQGLKALRARLAETITGGLETYLEEGGGILTNLRQKGCVDSCVTHLRRARRAYAEGWSEEFVLYDLRKALNSLGELTGEITLDDILEEIFSSFCIGK